MPNHAWYVIVNVKCITSMICRSKTQKMPAINAISKWVSSQEMACSGLSWGTWQHKCSSAKWTVWIAPGDRIIKPPIFLCSRNGQHDVHTLLESTVISCSSCFVLQLLIQYTHTIAKFPGLFRQQLWSCNIPVNAGAAANAVGLTAECVSASIQWLLSSSHFVF